MLLLATKQPVAEARCRGSSFNLDMSAMENTPRQQHPQDAVAEGALGRSGTFPPSQPALPHSKSSGQAYAASAASAEANASCAQQATAQTAAAAAGSVLKKATPLVLPDPPGGLSAASSPVTPPAVDVPLSATASPASHTATATTAATAAPAQAAAHQPGKTASSAAMSAAAVALTSTKHRLEGSLLLSQLLPLSASLGVALAAGDLRRMHAVLTLLQSVPMTGQLLFASQVAKPVRGILQQQMQLQTHGMQQQEQTQQGLLSEVVGCARGLLKRWKALLSAEVAACDDYRTTRAKQLLRALRKKKQCKTGAASAAAAATVTAAAAPAPAAQQTLQQPKHPEVTKHVHTVQQRSSMQQDTTAQQQKRTYSEWLQQQQQRGPVLDLSGAYPPRPSKLHKPGTPQPLPAIQQQQGMQRISSMGAGTALTAGVAAPHHPTGSVSSSGPSLGRSSSGLGFLGRSSSDFSLGCAGPESSAGDLADLGIDWEEPLMNLGADAAAAADAAIGAGGLSGGSGGGQGLWGVGEDEGELLVDGRVTLQGQVQEASAFVL